jgi:hypothetical protein
MAKNRIIIGSSSNAPMPIKTGKAIMLSAIHAKKISDITDLNIRIKKQWQRHLAPLPVSLAQTK